MIFLWRIICYFVFIPHFVAVFALHNQTLQKLQKFTDSIRTTKKITAKESNAAADGTTNNNDDVGGGGGGGVAGNDTSGTGEVGAVSYHGQVMEEDERNIDPEREKLELQNWFVGKLKCKRHIDDKYRNNSNSNSAPSGSDGRSSDDYAVIDPRKIRKQN